MELYDNEYYIFNLNGKEYHLKFEGDSPKVYYKGEKQKALTVLREYAIINKLKIRHENKTTQGIGTEYLKFLGLKKMRNNKNGKTESSKTKSQIKTRKTNIGKIVFSNGIVEVDAFIKHKREHKTNVTHLIRNVEHLIDSPKQLEISNSLFEPKDIYNSFIREHVDLQPGVYIWYDDFNQEVLYIGMAGKIKTNGELTNHPVRQRLQAPRCRDKQTKKDVLTNKYVYEVLKLLKIPSLKFIILFSKENEPAAYIESVLLYNYYKQHKVLPILNNAF